jgi:acyl-coenzyme A thioesterase PaaI-like protein
MSEPAALPPPRPRIVDEREAARDRLGASVRRLLDAVVGSAGSAEELTRVADEIDTVEALLAQSGAPRRPHDNPFHPMSLVGGTAHPVAPQLTFEPTERGVTATVRLGPVFEGGPTLAHGGVVALVFDHAMGAAVYLAGYAAMTRTLAVTYTAPTPLERELSVRAEVSGVDGRQVRVSATLAAGDTVTASAEAVFIVLTEDNLARIFTANP